MPVFKRNVWKQDTDLPRHERPADTLSEGVYMAAVSGLTVMGLALASVIGFSTMNWHPDLMTVLLTGLGLPIVGIFVSKLSRSWPISILGYLMIVVGLGAICGPTVALYKTAVVLIALVATMGVSTVMAIAGILYSKSLKNWGAYLFGALMALLFVRVAQIFMIGMGFQETLWYMPFVEYLGAVLFSLYIVYDWNRARDLPHTMENAVDSAVAIFLDIVNLFLQLLRVIGGPGVPSKD